MSGSSRVLAASVSKGENELMATVALRRATRDDGACAHEIETATGGAELLACPTGVAYLAASRTLLVADLHLEKGSSFARRGLMLPPHDTGLTLERLGASIARWKPAQVVALGDSFHDADGPARMALPDRRLLAGLQKGREWVWVTGNHDPLDADAPLDGEVTDEMVLDGLTLRHEPQVGAASEIAGHLHPKAAIVTGGRRIRRSCFAADATRMILPSFGIYTGGLSVLHGAFDGLFRGRRFHALMRGDAQVFKIAGTRLC